jgi:hypothetical protein
MSKFALLLSAAVMAASVGLSAQAAPPASRDFTGVWTNASLTPLARPKNVGKLELNAEEAKQQIAGNAIGGANDKVWTKEAHSDPNAGAPKQGSEDFGTKAYDTAWTAPGENLLMINGKYRSSNIVEPADGQLPYRDPASAAERRRIGGIKYATGNDPYIGPESTTLSERCLIGFGGTGGPGMLSVLYNNTYQFQLTDNYLAIEVEMAHDVRLIPIYANAAKARASHAPEVIKPWLGDSVAWWEGNTLVVETINIKPIQAENGPFYLSPKARVTERLTRRSDKEVFYEFTVDDPVTYTQPWKAQLAFRPQSRLFEYACHEGNYGLEGILAGARLKEKQAGAQAAGK